MKKHRSLIAINCLILAFSSLCYEFLLAQLLSIMDGNTVFYYCLTIGLFICAVGLGSLREAENLDEEGCRRRLIRIELFLAAIGGSSPIIFCLIDQMFLEGPLMPLRGSLIYIHSLFICLIGYASGMELPLLLRLAEINDDRSFFSKLLAIDYIASFIGAVSFPLFMYPQWGLVKSALVLGILNISAVLLMLPRQRRPLALSFALVFLAVYGTACWQAEAIEFWLSARIIGA